MGTVLKLENLPSAFLLHPRSWLPATRFVIGLLIHGLLSTAKAQDTDNPPDGLVVRSIRELRALSVEAAATERPVQLQGTVVYSRPKIATLFIHDGQQGVFVEQPTDYSGKGAKLGDRVEITGVSGAGLFAPVIRRLPDQGGKLVVLGAGELPPPRLVTGSELTQPELDCEWISVEAGVLEVMMKGDGVALECRSGPCEFSVVLEGPVAPDSVPWELAESRVRIRGVVATAFNNQRQMTRRFVRVSALADITILDGGPASGKPPVAARQADLLQLDGPGTDDLVKLEGTTTLTLPGEGLYLRSGDGGLWVQTAQPVNAAPGTRVEVEGWPRSGPTKPFLRSRRVRVLEAHGPPVPPRPHRMRAREAMQAGSEAELITVEADVLGKLAGSDGISLVLRDGDVVFRGLLSEGPDPMLPEVEIGSRVLISGVSQVTAVNTRVPLQVPEKLVVLMRDARDVIVVAAAPWWTTGRVAVAASGIFALLLAWVAVARARRLREQEARHLEYEAVLGERGRFAREIHDSLAQGLTSISLQLECVRDEIPEASPKVRGHIENASRLVRDSLKEARRTVWNLRPLALGEADLAGALQRFATELTRDGRITCRQEIEGNPRPLPAAQETALLRIGQEALTNAVRHAAPQEVVLRLHYGAERTSITIRDNGAGFDVLKPASQGFGLTGMRERVAALGGSLSIDSLPGEGTEVSVTLPS